MRLNRSDGFSLVELAVVLVIFGFLLAFSVPMLQGFSTTHQLKGASENIAGQLRLSRQVAIDTGKRQFVHFAYQSVVNGVLSDYHVHNGTVVGPLKGTGTLPRGITFDWVGGTQASYVITTDGRMSPSGWVILQDAKGNRDTVSVQTSGMVTCL